MERVNVVQKLTKKRRKVYLIYRMMNIHHLQKSHFHWAPEFFNIFPMKFIKPWSFCQPRKKPRYNLELPSQNLDFGLTNSSFNTASSDFKTSGGKNTPSFNLSSYIPRNLLARYFKVSLSFGSSVSRPRFHEAKFDLKC